MINLKDFSKQLKKEIDNRDKEKQYNRNLVSFLEDNRWFDIRVKKINENYYLDENDAQYIKQKLKIYLLNKDKSVKDKIELIFVAYREMYPDTIKKIRDFLSECQITTKEVYDLLSFLMRYIMKEIAFFSDADIIDLVKIGEEQLQKKSLSNLIWLLNWILENYQVSFRSKPKINELRYQSSCKTAYSVDTYCLALQELTVDVEKKFTKAASSRDYCDTWLYLVLHFFTAMRDTDIVKIKHPTLPIKAEKILNSAKEGKFNKAYAKKASNDVMDYFDYLDVKINKTKSNPKSNYLYFDFGRKGEILIGTLLLIAEAHFVLNRVPSDKNLIRVIKDKYQIEKYLGKEIANIFEGDFSNRRMNKTYMQLLCETAKEDGYDIASISRGHKGVINGTASTTSVYLKNNKIGLSPKEIMGELFERGVLSFTIYQLYSVITEGSFKTLGMPEQTQIIKQSKLSAYKTETISKVYHQSQQKALDIYSTFSDPEKDLTNFLKNIYLQKAASKESNLYCIQSALNKTCTHPEINNCFCCDNCIFTERFLSRMITDILICESEHKKLIDSYPIEAKKNKHFSNFLSARLGELIALIENTYPDTEKEILLNYIFLLLDEAKNKSFFRGENNE